MPTDPKTSASNVQKMPDPYRKPDPAALSLAEIEDLLYNCAVVRHTHWAVTTEADCLGQPPDSIDPVRYALYDADEDDPPVAVFTFPEDAQSVAMALNTFAPLARQLIDASERLAATEASRDNANYALRRANEELAATEAVAKRSRDGCWVWHDDYADNGEPCWFWMANTGLEPMTDAERQVLDRLNAPSPE